MDRSVTLFGQQRRGSRRRLVSVLVLSALVLTLLPAAAVRAATFVVTNILDTGPGSLRAAIIAANATPAADTITFAIPGPGVKTIAPLTALPDITAPVTINGYSQPGAAANTLAVGNDAVLLIELSGALAPAGSDGLRLDTDDSNIRGLVINGWRELSSASDLGGSGVRLLAGADRNVIRGNFIGTNAAGSAAVANETAGVRIVDAADNVVGGLTAGARNVISGNKVGVLVAGGGSTRNDLVGNYIGTDASGLLAVANMDGVGLVGNANVNVVGGTTDAARNVISGNTRFGVVISTGLGGTPGTTGNAVQGNHIGVDATGDAALGNDVGVRLIITNQQSLGDNVIGGLVAGAGNTISGNDTHGIWFDTGSGAGSGTNLIQGNLIGTTPAGDAAMGNGDDGIRLSFGFDTVGGTTAAARNVISGNGGNGITLGAGDASFEVLGNYIGTDGSGTVPLPNAGHGVELRGAALDNTIGSTAAGGGNVIAFNALDGIAVIPEDGFSPVVNRFRANSIHSNGGLGIDLGNDGVTPNDPGDADTGPNFLQNYPELLSAVLLSDGTTRVRVKLDVQPNDTYSVDLYSNEAADPTGFGEGQTYLGTADIVVGASGMANELVTLPVPVPVGMLVTSTATSGPNTELSTSEFSEAIAVVPAVRIDDVSQDEGDTGTTDFDFTVSLAAAAEETVTVDFDTADGTASAPSDYSARSGTLTFTAGQTSKTITVQVNGDTDVESDETFFVDLSDLSLGADAVEDGRGRGTIDNDDEADPGDEPSLSIDDVAELEGHEGKKPFVFTVTRAGDTSGSSSVRFRTEEGTATVPQDYKPIADDLLTFEPGQSEGTITVKVKGDGKHAPDEVFTVVLFDAVDATIEDGTGTGTIINDDPYLVIADRSVNAPASGRRTVEVLVTLSYPTLVNVRVDYATRDGTAVAGSDYLAKTGRLVFQPGQSSERIEITIKRNRPGESNERFFVDLFDVRRGFIRDGTARITIRD